MINMAQLKTVYRKELKDTLRDKRTLMALGFTVFGGPLFIMLVFYLISLGSDERPTSLLVSGADQAPGLVAFVEKKGIRVTKGSIEGEVPQKLPQDIDGILIIPDTYGADLEAARMVPLRLFVDGTGATTLKRAREVETALHSYSGHVAGLRLVSRGIPTGLLQPMALTSVDISKNSFADRFMSEMLLLMVIFAPFYTGLSVAIDVLAGERERSSLQSLLAQPVSALTVTLGKWGAVCTFGVSGTLAVLGVLVIQFNVFSFDFVAVVPTFDPLLLLILALQLTPLAMFVGALQMFFSIQAKSFREAQTYLSMMMSLPFILGYVKILADDKLPEFARYLPVMADIESASSILYRGDISAGHFALSLVVSVVGIVLVLGLTARRLDSERLLDAN